MKLSQARHVKWQWRMMWRGWWDGVVVVVVVVVVWPSGWKHKAQGWGLGQKPKTELSQLSFRCNT